MSSEVEYKLSLRIEQDESVPVPLVQVALDTTDEEEGKVAVVVVATNWAASDTGAAAVASFLREAANAIDAELGNPVSGAKLADTQNRPRFNPQPRGQK